MALIFASDLARNQLSGEIPRILYWNEVLQYLWVYFSFKINDLFCFIYSSIYGLLFCLALHIFFVGLMLIVDCILTRQLTH